MKGIVFNIQRYSIDDGPGIRTTVFLKGCPLRCLWCSNPESQKSRPEIAHRDTLCNKCGKCVEICDRHAISVDEQGVHINRNSCDQCGKCIDVCTPKALEILGKEMSVEEVLQEVRKDIQYYQISGGGLTASGGEPLNQSAFVTALFKQCLEESINTCMETCGYGHKTDLEKILPYTSLVLFDLKHMDPVMHKKLTGLSNKLIISNLNFIVSKGIPVIIRVPIIPGFNDSNGEITAVARTVAANKVLKKVQLMPYHRYGTGKYKMLDREYKLAEITRPEEDKLEKVKEIFENFGLECEILKN